MQKPRIPKYRRQSRKSGDLAFVELNGQRHYLGKFDTPASREKYHRLLAEWTAGGQQLPLDPQHISIVELMARFWKHAETHYRKPDGTPTSELDLYRNALKLLRELYGNCNVSEFGPLKLKAVREKMIDRCWSRKNVNSMVGRIRRVFKWGVENELVTPDVLRGLQAVGGLQRGRCKAKESEPVRPVPEAHINAVEPYVSRQVWSLIQLQLHTGSRPGELLSMRAVDIDTGGKVWTFTPDDHKTAHHGHRRTIYIGPKAQDILKPFMADRPLTAYLFSPREAEQERRDKCSTHRRPDQRLVKSKTKRKVREYYDNASYRRAIRRACDKAGVPRWAPNRLRHNAATFIRREYGIEMARVLLGHTRLNTTEIYAEADYLRQCRVLRPERARRGGTTATY